ncbi:MAG: D-alanine--D-alanine ligase [bacterium]|nr:D-alanine--D-alanine ligase [bacterium]
MRICLLTTQDLDSDPFPDDDWPCDPRPFMPEADWRAVCLEKPTAVATVRSLVAEGFDVFFNLCDGAADEDRPGIEVVRALEKLGAPFTGATSVFYEPTRQRMKQLCRREGIASPASVLARTEDDVERAAHKLRFPLFVKHYSSYASVDLSRSSKVLTPAGLRRQARKIMSRHGKALIEEYIAGEEYTVLVAENPRNKQRPTTYTPMRYVFPPGESFKHADMKWVDFDDMRCEPMPDSPLARRLRQESARIFVVLDGASFGRCDWRVDEEGTPYLLEINANCGIYYGPDAYGGADLCLVNSPGGHEAFTRQLVAAALKRAAAR